MRSARGPAHDVAERLEQLLPTAPPQAYRSWGWHRLLSHGELRDEGRGLLAPDGSITIHVALTARCLDM